MKSTIRWRLAGFGLAILGLVAFIAWAARATGRQVGTLSERLTRSQLETFQTADQFRADLQQLNSRLFRYRLNHDPGEWERFLSARRKLDDWIDTQQPRLTTPEEHRILDAINAAYDDYFAAAKRLDDSVRRPSQIPAAADVAARLERESERLLELDNDLLTAHRVSLDRLLADSRRSWVRLRWLVFGALGGLLALGAGVAAIVYREMIQPLRHKLVESHAIIERQEKLASLGVLAAGVAHEIRNPLTAIKARLYTQQKSLPAGSREAEDALFIGKEIHRLERIVKEVLQFARPAEPRLEAVMAEAVLRETQELMAPPLRKHGVELRLGPVADAAVRADSQQLKQVLINLVQNAAESIAQEGTVTLSARRESRRLRGHPAGVVTLEVADTGHGIPPEVQKRLFDPFFTTKQGGTGLGLAIAARILEKHGGAIEFRTQPNVGTTFGLRLPSADLPDPGPTRNAY